MSNIYVCSLWWQDIFLGDYTSIQEADEHRAEWIKVCKDPSAKDPTEYRIVPYSEG